MQLLFSVHGEFENDFLFGAIIFPNSFYLCVQGSVGECTDVSMRSESTNDGDVTMNSNVDMQTNYMNTAVKLEVPSPQKLTPIKSLPFSPSRVCFENLCCWQ